MHSAERLHSTMEICGGLTQETTLHFHPFARMGLLEAFLSVFGTLKTCSYKGIMSAPESIGNNTQKKLIKIDISSDTVCPWCFVGKKNLDKAIAASKDHYDFKVFRGHGLEYNLSGLTGNTLDSHRLMHFAGQQGLDKQHNLMEVLSLGYFTQAKFIGDQEFLLESAKEVGIEGAEEFLRDPNNGLKEVNEELEKYSASISGVPYFVINGSQKLSGAQPPEVFLRAFQVV